MPGVTIRATPYNSPKQMNFLISAQIPTKEIEKYLTEEQKKELEELERRIANS